MRIRTWWMACLIALGLGACRGTYLEGVHEEQLQSLTRFIESKGVKPWAYRGVLCGVQVPGDSLRIGDGDTLHFRYSIHALGGRAAVVETNDTAVARQHGLAVLPVDTLYTYVVGRSQTVRGLDLALSHLARGRSKLWIGIPSSLAYGGRQIGLVKPHTALCYELEIIGASSEIVRDSNE